MLDFETIKLLCYGLFGVAFIYFLLKSDEIPLLLVYFLYATGITRYEAVISGDVSWVVVNYVGNFFDLNDELAVIALNFFVLGTGVFLLAYMFFRGVIKKQKRITDSQEKFKKYSLDKQNVILVGALIFFPLSGAMLGMMSGSIALGNSYFWLFSLAVGGVIVLLYNNFRYIKLDSFLIKLGYALVLVYAVVYSFNPSVRFQFLSWAIAVGIYFAGAFTVKKKLLYYGVGGIAIVLVFAIAGVARSQDYNTMSWEQRIDNAVARNDSKADQNMLDGFMMVLQVYPEHLDFQYGTEHLSIFARPIPRQLWPGKPVGGYANKLGLNDVEKGTVGISQTLYGSFYEEGGIWGIIIFAVLYAFLFASLMAYSESFNSDLRWIIKGITVASLLPLLRGGDLPGIYAFIGMSFWPVFVFIRYYLKRIKYDAA